MKLSPQAKKYLADVALLAASQVILYFGVKFILSAHDPMKSHHRRRKAELEKRNISAAKGTPGAISERMKLQKRLKEAGLSEHEEVIAEEIVVVGEEEEVGFDNIGGLDTIIQALQESVIYPLIYPQLFATVTDGTSSPPKKNKLLGAPKGVLLYGPPGCGKTMLARALAKESGATFINLHVSTLTEKWFGESQKLVNAVFTLAKKLEPSIIFIDEVDSFLRERRSTDHETTAMMKAEFMTLWDGLASNDYNRILVIGATNRPHDLDKAIVRRMPKRFAIKLPNKSQRKKILELMLKDTKLDSTFNFDDIVDQTIGYSGSDLKELCRNAAIIPVREYLRSKTSSASASNPPSGTGGTSRQLVDFSHVNVAEIRPVRNSDFFKNESMDGMDGLVDGYDGLEGFAGVNGNNADEDEDELD
ncbi:P-loop containing nucleoside triphosphate hydrolase protein [Paraphysoderma sedebokerense]|nr:P-loop containing nucleoside triphosphate hydrolase protein [Paraphysoderma sedebokerense]